MRLGELLCTLSLRMPQKPNSVTKSLRTENAFRKIMTVMIMMMTIVIIIIIIQKQYKKGHGGRGVYDQAKYS